MKNRLLSAGFCALCLMFSQESHASATPAEGGAADATADVQENKSPTFAALLQTSEAFNDNLALLGEDRTALYHRVVAQASTLNQFLTLVLSYPKLNLLFSIKMIGREKVRELLENLNQASRTIPYNHEKTFTFSDFKAFKTLTFKNFSDVEPLIPDAYRATYDVRSHYPVESKEAIQNALLKHFQEKIQDPIQKLKAKIIAANGFPFLANQKAPDPLPATDVLLDIHANQRALYKNLSPFIQRLRTSQIGQVRELKAFMALYALPVTAPFDDRPETAISPTLLEQGQEWVKNLLPTVTPILYQNGIKISTTVVVNNLEYLLFRDLLQRVMTSMTDFFQTSDPTRINWELLGLERLAQGYFNLQTQVTATPAQKQKSFDSAIMTSPPIKTVSDFQHYVEAQLQLAATLRDMQGIVAKRLGEETAVINRHLDQTRFGVPHQPESTQRSEPTTSAVQDEAAQAPESLSPKKDLAFLLQQPFSFVAIAVTNTEARRALHQHFLDLRNALQKCKIYLKEPTELSFLGYRVCIDWFLRKNPDFLEKINIESQNVAYSFMYGRKPFNLTAESIATLHSPFTFDTIEHVLPPYVQQTYHEDTQYGRDQHGRDSDSRTHEYIKEQIITFFTKHVQTPLQKAWKEFQEMVGLESGAKAASSPNTETLLDLINIQQALLESLRPPLEKLHQEHIEAFHALQPFLEEEGLSVSLPFEASLTADLTLAMIDQGDAYIKKACTVLSTALYKRANAMRTHPLLTELSKLNPKTQRLFRAVIQHYDVPIAENEGIDFGNPQAPAYTAVPWEILGLDGLAHSCWTPFAVTPLPQVKGKPAQLALPAPERKTPTVDDPTLLLRHLTGQHTAALILRGMIANIENDVQGQRAAITTIFAGPALGYVDPLRLTEGDGASAAAAEKGESDVEPSAAPVHRMPPDDDSKDFLD